MLLRHIYTMNTTNTLTKDWRPDILGDSFEMKYVRHPDDYCGEVRSSIIRYKGTAGAAKGILYVHGFSDYFFQKELAEMFAAHGYAFYAVDLRRYGRSLSAGQKMFRVRDLHEYFADIDSALSQIRRDGNTDITLGGHSTGGLTVAYFGAERGKDVGVDRIVTDSPFLEWNFSSFMRNIAIPTVGFFGKIFKNVKINQGHCDGYAYSLLKEYYGEWTYDTDWKMVYSPPVTASWLGAINTAQSRLMKKSKEIAVPILVMHSSRKIEGCNYTPDFQTGDAVLDPAMIQKRGERLGTNPTVCAIDSGLHDLILSSPKAREAAYDTLFTFIRTH